MTKASLDFQIQQQTQAAIATLQKNMDHLAGMVQAIDQNMRQSHMVLFQDVMQLRVRVNFLLDELKNSLPEDKQKEVEDKFMAFAQKAQAQMQKDVAAEIAAREAATEKEKANAPESNIISQ